MDSLPTSLDLDQNLEIPVKIAGREFKLTQQSWPVLKRITTYINTDGKSEGAATSEEMVESAVGSTGEDVMAKNYEASVPIIALMFGFVQDDTTKQEVVDFLTLNLTPAKALTIFKTWWKLNEVDDFFDQGGRTLMHPDIAQAIKSQLKAKAIGEEISS